MFGGLKIVFLFYLFVFYLGSLVLQVDISFVTNYSFGWSVSMTKVAQFWVKR